MKVKKIMPLRSTFLFLLLVTLIACVPIVKNDLQLEEVAFSKFLRGTVYLEGDDYKIRLCGASSIDQLLDPDQFLSKHFFDNKQQIPSLYVEFNAVGANGFDWQLTKLYFISKKPQACGANIQAIDYLVTAKDGQWQADVSDNKVRLVKQSIFTKLTFNAPNHDDNKWQADLQLAQGKQYKLKLHVFNQECSDDFGQWYSLSANMYLNSQLHAGCVRKGDRTKSFVSGKYSNALAIDNAFIVLNLEENNTADMIIDYRSGHPMIISNGYWKMRANQVLELSLHSEANIPEQNVMLFQVFNNHELRLKGFSELLGKTGLKLLPIK
jgi:hypothetical protein